MTSRPGFRVDSRVGNFCSFRLAGTCAIIYLLVIRFLVQVQTYMFSISGSIYLYHPKTPVSSPSIYWLSYMIQIKAATKTKTLKDKTSKISSIFPNECVERCHNSGLGIFPPCQLLYCILPVTISPKNLLISFWALAIAVFRRVGSGGGETQR